MAKIVIMSAPEIIVHSLRRRWLGKIAHTVEMPLLI